MKKLICILIAVLMLGVMVQGCSPEAGSADTPQSPEASDTGAPEASSSEAPSDPGAQETGITSEMAYEGVNNYCHSEYDWSIAEENPSIMYVEMGEETDSGYKVVFRSYTGALTNFYVDKASGETKIVEYNPSLDAENEVGTIQIRDYLEKK